MMVLMIIIALCNLVTLVTPGHIWSQVVTVVTNSKTLDLKKEGMLASQRHCIRGLGHPEINIRPPVVTQCTYDYSGTST